LLPLRALGGFLLCTLPLWLSAQTTGQNYIVTTVPYQTVSDPTTLTDANSNTSIQYFDGLGRPTETIQKAISGITGSDLVKLTEYDGVGREYRHWLPITSTGNGAYVTPSTITANTTTLYGSDGKPYTTTNYEPSPLNRVTGQYGAGASWYAGKKNDSILYQTNAGEVAYFFVNTSNQLVRGNGTTNYYDANTLYKTVATDEDGKPTTEYKDKLGQVVLKRQSCNGENVDTYYVYNDLGQLCYVLPPKFIDGMGSTTSFDDANVLLRQFGYLYRYDERGNCNFKRLPGCTPIYMVYDKANRMVLSQNGNQRKQLQANLIQWSVTKYDSFGRAVFTGLMYRTEIDSTQNYKSIRDIISNVVVTESYSGFSTSTPLTISYYDNYNFIPSGNNLNYDSSQEQNGYTAYYSNAKGLLTGARVYHLNDPNASETTALYYDKYGRVVQTRATNHLLGYDITYNKLDFKGKVTKSRKEHNISGQAVIPEVYRYAYDKAERLILTRYKLGANDTITLAANSYDELGRLRVKVLGAVDATTYSYNVRSWTTDISGSRFSENLYYNSNPLSSNVCFNGNIAGIQWDVPNEGIGHKRAYSFVYDNLNRLTNANYYGIYNGSVVAGTSDRYNETFTFDKMGNITNFVRNGLQSNNSTKIYSKVDDLVLEHVGNQLTRITDYGTNGSFYGDEEFFKNTNVSVNSCAYDANGNRLYDSNSNIWGIRYNLLNLPDAMQFYQGHQTNYTYSATGAKLKVIDKTAPPGAELPVTSLNTVLTSPSVSMVTTTDYVGNMIYENGTLKRIVTPVGYWQAGIYYYFLKDHLGSNRVVMTGSGGIAETSNYYPSGMRFGESSAILTNSIQPYRHTGHEMQEMHGLNWIDNLARFRTVSDGSGFTGLDPLAEKYYSISPYAYCGGNPINRIDLNGKQIINKIDRVTYTDADATNLFKGITNVSKSGSGYSIHFVSQERTPEIYKHTLNSFRMGKPNILHYESDKKVQRSNRYQATKNLPPRGSEGLERDEYPYASTKEGGVGANVAYVPKGENGKQGNDLQVIYKTMNDGDAFLVLPLPKDKEPNPVPVLSPEASPVNGYLNKMQDVTGLTGAALIFYLIISEGSRVYPPRNLIPVP